MHSSPQGCSSTRNNRWALHAAHIPIYYRQALIFLDKQIYILQKHYLSFHGEAGLVEGEGSFAAIGLQGRYVRAANVPESKGKEAIFILK